MTSAGTCGAGGRQHFLSQACRFLHSLRCPPELSGGTRRDGAALVTEPMEPTDQDYVARCLDGHPDDFRHLVLRYQGVLGSYLGGRLGDRAAAEEAAQETFARAFFSLKRLRAAGSFFAWLMGIAERVAMEQRRAERRMREVAAAAAEARAAGRRDDAAAGAEDHELRRAVAALPEAYRQVVLLRYYADLSCAQVAERLGLPLGTVTKTLSRAYAMLREELRDDNVNEHAGPRDADRRPEVQR